MKNNKILVAFDSQTMLNFFANLLSDKGYEVITAKNGVEALDAICEKRPFLAFLYVDLPVVSGWNLARIIKNSRQIKDTFVAICVSETTGVFNFWMEKSGADDLLAMENLDIEKLECVIGKVSAKNLEAENQEQKPLTRAEIIKLVSESGERELFKLYIVQNAFDTGVATFSVEQLADAMIKDLAGICKYDAVGIIVNDEVLIERYDHSKKLLRADLDDFEQICHRDFETKISDRKDYDWKTSTIKRTLFETQGMAGGDKIKSYDAFPANKASVVTLHIASCEADAFNSRVTERLEYFVDVYARIITKNLRFRRVSDAEQKMRKAFSRFVPDIVIDEIVSGAEAAQTSVGEKRNVAIMMADIRRFTTISEVNEPENVVNFLNYFFSIMGPIIKKHGGTIDKFMGDAIMALFGAPESFEDNGNRAACAALEMMEAMKTVDTSRIKLPSFYKFAIGIGIHYGAPIVGAIGSEDKRDYTVIGDDVNLASRVEGLSKIYGVPVIITESVKKDLKNAQPVRLLDRVKVKGKDKPIEIYEMILPDQAYAKEFLDAYSKGVKQYMIGNFDGGVNYFKQALDIKVDDKATHVLLGRCKEYIDSPPLIWDGAVALQSK